MTCRAHWTGLARSMPIPRAMRDSTRTSDGLDTDPERTRAYVRSIALKYVHNDHDADDVTQDAMLLAHRYRNAFRGDSRYSTWLYRVTVTAALMFLRKQRRLAREVPASGTGISDEDGTPWLERVAAPNDLRAE